DLINTLKNQKIQYDLKGNVLNETLDIREITNIRHELEDLLSAKKEEKYELRQAEEWEQISAYMDVISSNKNSKIINDEEITIPATERPAYFEWILWRAFLALNGLHNKPNKSRRFKIDQDFLPVGTAPGNGPDLIFEFGDFVVVVEVT